MTKNNLTKNTMTKNTLTKNNLTKNTLLGLAAAAVSLAYVASANAEVAFGLAGGSLVRFDTAAPGTVTSVGTITGVPSTFTIRSIDFRPANQTLYAFATGGTAASQYSLLTINTNTGVATPVAAPVTTTAAFTLTTSIDFNPVVDLLRVVVGENRRNLRVNPTTGALVSEDPLVNYVNANGRGTPRIAGVAYTNNLPGATSTTLYGWDYNAEGLAQFVAPNAGTMNALGVDVPDGISASSTSVGFDISAATGTAYLSYSDANTSANTLSTVNLTTGALTTLGTFGSTAIVDIAVVVPEPSALGLLGLPAAALLRRRRA